MITRNAYRIPSWSALNEQPRQYVARDIDLTVATGSSDGEYTITPALINAVGRRETNADTYSDRIIRCEAVRPHFYGRTAVIGCFKYER